MDMCFFYSPSPKSVIWFKILFRPQTKKILKKTQVFFLCVLMLSCTSAMTISGIATDSVTAHALTALGVLVVILIAFSLVLRPVVAKVNAFFLLQGSLSITISGASFYFFTDNAEEFPDGPHFSTTFFVTVLGVIGTIFSLFGLVIYNRYLSEMTFVTLLTFTNVVSSLMALSDLIIFTRKNKEWGIPDHHFVLGGTVGENKCWGYL